VGVPELQRLAEGGLVTEAPFALPQAPLVGFCTLPEAEQKAVTPPLEPMQLHDHGPEPETFEAVPLLQRFCMGIAFENPLAEPQAPLTGGMVCKEAEQIAVTPPLAPEQLQDHGPEPETVDAVPVPQRLAAGLVLTVAPFAEPHVPLRMGGT